MAALRVERDGDVLFVTFARPEVRNAFDATLIEELSQVFVDVGSARAVVLAGDGPSFCAGADVAWMRASVDLDFEANVADANALRRMLEAIDSCPAPVVAVVQGHADIWREVLAQDGNSRHPFFFGFADRERKCFGEVAQMAADRPFLARPVAVRNAGNHHSQQNGGDDGA